MLQDEYRDLYKKINSGWDDSVSRYKDIVRKYINGDTVVLEAGCGFSDMFEKEYAKAKKVIGLDISEEFLAKNTVVDEKIVSPLEDMSPVSDNSVDLVISSWVLEHVQDPKRVFHEISRVLKPGGRFVFLAPNKWNYVVMLNSIISKKMRMFVVQRMAQDLETDPMPAYYRANSVGVIQRLAKENDMTIERLIVNGDPTYVAVNTLFFYIGVVIEAILALPVLRRTKVHLIGVLRKDNENR